MLQIAVRFGFALRKVMGMEDAGCRDKAVMRGTGWVVMHRARRTELALLGEPAVARQKRERGNAYFKRRGLGGADRVLAERVAPGGHSAVVDAAKSQ